MRHLLAISLLCWVTAASSASSPSEYELKAALLYRLAKFIEWPGVDRPNPTMEFCVVGGGAPAGPFRDLEGKRVHDRKIVVSLRRSEDADLMDCDVAFFTDPERPSLRRQLAGVEDQPVLTVSDRPGFATIGGIVNFTPQNNRFGLEINADQSARQGLRIQSQLLALATIVQSPP